MDGYDAAGMAGFVGGFEFPRLERVVSGAHTIGGGGVTLLEGVTFNAPSGTARVQVPLTLGAAASITSANVGATLNIESTLDLGNQQSLTTEGKGDINVSGIVSGTGGAGITKLGEGTLILGGAIFVVWADVACRTLPASDLRLGVVTALVGGPFFLYLLVRRRRQEAE